MSPRSVLVARAAEALEDGSVILHGDCSVIEVQFANEEAAEAVAGIVADAAAAKEAHR